MSEEQGTAPATSTPEAEPQEASETPFAMGRVGKHTLIYGLGIVLMKAVSFIMLPIYTRYLTPADYGVMELIEMTLDVISIIAGAQVAVGIFRYYYKAETEEERNQVVSTSFVALVLSYGVISALIAIAAPTLSVLVFETGEHAWLIQLAAASMALSSLSITPLTYIRVREHSTLFVIVQLIKAILQVALNLLFLVQMELGVQGVFLSSLIANGVIGAGLGIYMVRHVGLALSRSATRNLLRYGVPLIGTQMANFFATFGDRYFLQRAADTSTVGLYTLAYQFAFLLAAVGYMPFEMIWQPVRFEVAKRPDRDEIYSKGFLYMSLVLICLAVALAVMIGDILRMMTSPAFHPAAQYVPVILVAYVLQGWTMVQDTGIHMREKTEYITLASWASAIIAMCGFALFVPEYLAMGAATVTVFAFLVRYVGVYVASQRLWRIEYEWWPVIKLIVLGLVTYAISTTFTVENLWLSILARSALLLGLLGAILAAGIIPRDDIASGMAMVKQFREGLARGREAT